MIGEKYDAFLQENVQKYATTRQNYVDFGKIVGEILNKMVKSVAVEYFVQYRAKDVPSYAEKLIRKKWDNRDYEISDMTGTRVTLANVNDMEKFRQLVETNFECLENEDTGSRLKTDQFGYLSIHYMIKLKPDSEFCKQFSPDALSALGINGKSIQDFYSFQAELQVRTVLQHAWSINGHDQLYKSSAKLPESLKRKFIRIAAILEQVDQDFRNLTYEVDLYESNYGAYLSKEEIQTKLEKNVAIYRNLPKNLAEKDKIKWSKTVVKMARYEGRWDIIEDVLSPLANLKNNFVLRELGIALCKKTPSSKEVIDQGIAYLKEAIQLGSGDSDACASLGGVFRRQNDLIGAMDQYKRAYQIDPRNNYALGNYLLLQVESSKSMDLINLSGPLLIEAIKTSKWQIESDINIPWAYYDMGLFSLLKKENLQSLVGYYEGVQNSSELWMIESAEDALEVLQSHESELLALDKIKTLLKLSIEKKKANPHWIPKPINHDDFKAVLDTNKNIADLL